MLRINNAHCIGRNTLTLLHPTIYRMLTYAYKKRVLQLRNMSK